LKAHSIFLGDDMDFEKIFNEFKAAEAADDFEKMSDIIAQIHKYCGGLAQAGRASEIPPPAKYIGSYINVLIYQIMKLLTCGKLDKAKFYIYLLTLYGKDFLGGYSDLYYLLGKTLYATGDYPRAAKIFNVYEKNRYALWQDVDELSLFYRANALAFIGNFQAAQNIYEQILTIKANFPEVKKNLEIVRRNSNKNLVREIKSLWNFPHWRDVPIFINARDRLGVMKNLIDWLLNAGYRNLIVLDNNSTYPPLLKYYFELEKDSRLKIIRLKKNFGFKALWLSGVLEQLKISTPYIYTDPDILPIENCPKNFVKQLFNILNSNHEVRKVGLGLVWKDITFFDKESVKEIESSFYDGTRIGKNLYFVQIDTTLALYSNVRHYSLRLSLRTAGDLQAYHLPWYFDYNNLPDDEKYYMAHADKNSVTSIKKFWE